MKIPLLFFLSLSSIIIPTVAIGQLQNQVSLDDVEIKGEAAGAKGLGLSAREKNDLSGRIKIKSDFTSDILEELPVGFKIPEKFTLMTDRQQN